MVKHFVLSLGIIASLLPGAVIAAPFCLTIQGIAPQCIYDDPASCKQRAAQLSGICTVNVDEVTSHTGAEKFCSVDATRIPQCIYADRTGCDNVQQAGSICVYNTFQQNKDDVADPFAADPNRNF